MLGLQGKVPNVSAGSSFQFLMVLFTKEYFQTSVLCYLPLIFRTWSTRNMINPHLTVSHPPSPHI